LYLWALLELLAGVQAQTQKLTQMNADLWIHADQMAFHASTLQGVQERHQVIKLLLIQYSIEGRHVAAARHDRLSHMWVSCRHSAGKSLLAEHANKRRPLQWLLFVGVVTDGAARLKNLASMLLFDG